MRTTLTIDDSIAKKLKENAHQTGKSFKATVNETLQAGLVAKKVMQKARSYRMKPASMGGAVEGYNLNKALALADHIEDKEILRKMNAKK
ncbi:MAG: hypothetical protein ACE5DN_07195 [Flavobacteriales bacterium]